MDLQNEKQLLPTDSFVILNWLVYWVAPLDKKVIGNHRFQNSAYFTLLDA